MVHIGFIFEYRIYINRVLIFYHSKQKNKDDMKNKFYLQYYNLRYYLYRIDFEMSVDVINTNIYLFLTNNIYK